MLLSVLGLYSYKICSPSSLMLSSSVSILNTVQLFRFAMTKINLSKYMFISKISDLFIFIKLCSHSMTVCLTFSLKIVIMLLKALFALFSYFIYSAFIIKISNLSVLFNPLVHVFYAVFAHPP